jgi:ribosomal protein S27AE
MAERSFYKKYINSGDWYKKRLQKLKSINYKCERCGQSRSIKTMQVHHKTYERLGYELLEDL